MYTILQLTSEAQIRSFLMADPDFAAYALGDLEPPYAEHATWFGAFQGTTLDAVALHYTSLDPVVLFLMGESSALNTMLKQQPGPERVYYAAKPHIEPLLRKHFELVEVYHMYRMRVSGASFARSADFGTAPAPPTLLSLSHVEAIQTLQHVAARSDARAVHDIAFAPDMVADGYYYGVFEHGVLIAVAGTHIVARHSEIAALGNVVVHPDKRGQGLGTRVSHAVTQALIGDGFHTIVLNVRQDNIPAIRTYEKLGYQHTGNFIEGLAVRR